MSTAAARKIDLNFESVSDDGEGEVGVRPKNCRRFNGK
jgi:hypothetical protein